MKILASGCALLFGMSAMAQTLASPDNHTNNAMPSIEEKSVRIPETYRNILNSGSAYASLTLHWGDNLAIDNLTSAVLFSGDTSVGSILESALQNDSRFYALKNKNNEYVAYGFDTNGDNSAAITVNDIKLSLSDGVATATEEIFSSKGSSDYDHWAINSDENRWKVYVNGVEGDLTTSVKNEDSIILAYGEVDTDNLNTFYLRQDDVRGVWMQPEIRFNTADGKTQYFPMISNMITTSDLYGAGVSFEITNEKGETSTAYSLWTQNASTGGNSVRVIASSGENAIIKPYINTHVEGVITRVYTDEPTKININIANPVTGIRLTGWPEGDIHLYDMFGFRAYAEPADADFPTIVYELDNNDAAEIYARSSYEFDHFFAHNIGSYKLTARTSDGSVSVTKDFTIIDRERPEITDFSQGTFWLNEEWFGHSNGSINYINPDGTILTRVYELVNPFEGFGCTSQYATVFGGKLIVMSKQYKDGGDPHTGGGRLTIADARTLEKLAFHNDLRNGDGRACVGVNAHKAYIGGAQGIGVLNLDDLSYEAKKITGLPTGGSTYSSQYGDMVLGGKYVFAVRQGTGLVVIDTESDECVKTFPNTTIQGVARTAEGTVWYVDYASGKSTIYGINPETLEETASYVIPGGVSCEWGSWRSTKFFAAKRSNKLFWGINYCWDMDKDETPENVQPIITNADDRWPMTTNNKKQGIYGSAAFDDRTGEILWSGNQGFGLDGRFTWYNFTNIETGDIKSVRVLPDYYYFPAIPVIPDTYAAELVDELYQVEFSDKTNEAAKIDLSSIIDDKDSPASFIKFELGDVEHTPFSRPVARAAEESSDKVVDVELTGKTLTVKPIQSGVAKIHLSAESNGVVNDIVLPVAVNDALLGINSIKANTSVAVNGGKAIVKGYAGHIFNIFNMNGMVVDTFNVNDDNCVYHLTLSKGVYVLSADNGDSYKVVVK